jgi:hypothetical protein
MKYLSQISFLALVIWCNSLNLTAQTANSDIGEVEHMWDAKVTIDEGLIVGDSKHGWRRIVAKVKEGEKPYVVVGVYRLL